MRVITSSQLNAVSGSTAVCTLGATGAGPFAWSITGGADAALFSVVEATGVLTFNDAPDYDAPGDGNGDNVYAVEVTGTATAGVVSRLLFIVVRPTDYRRPRGANHR